MLFFISIMTMCILATLSPGPNFLMVSGTSLCYGRRCGLITTLGVCTGLAISFTACLLGIKIIFAYATLRKTIYIIGGLYMIYAAFKICYPLFAKPKQINTESISENTNTGQNIDSLQDQQLLLPASDRELFKRGVTASVINPGVYIFYSAIYSKIALEYNNDFKIGISYTVLFLVVEIIYFCGIAVLFSSLAGFFKQYSKYINAALCVILAFTGVDMIIKGIVGT